MLIIRNCVNKDKKIRSLKTVLFLEINYIRRELFLTALKEKWNKSQKKDLKG